MLRSIKQIYGDKLGASDGEIGHVKDFYFDDLDWVVRYLVADTGSWMPARLVLISPHAMGQLYQGGKVLLVNLTRQQIEDSPSIDSHKPLSRQYEEEYHRYYGWPFYWRGDALWGMSGFPILSQGSEPFHGEPPSPTPRKRNRADAHLRSARAITGYKVEASHELVGHVADFLVDDKTWAINHLVFDASSSLSGGKVLVPPKQVRRISWDDSKVILKLTKEALRRAPRYDDAEAVAHDHDPRIVWS